MHASYLVQLIAGRPAAELIIGSGSTGRWIPITPEDFSDNPMADEYDIISGYDERTLVELQKYTTDGTDLGPIENIHCILARRISFASYAFLVVWDHPHDGGPGPLERFSRIF